MTLSAICRSSAPPCSYLLLTVMSMAALGCNSESHRPVAPVSGKVLVDGAPASKALVIFHPQNDPDGKAPRPTGEVGADGTFTLNTYTAGDGAPPGAYAVTVLWLEGSSTTGGDAGSGPDRLGNRYANPKTTTLRAEVGAGANELEPFRLKK